MKNEQIYTETTIIEPGRSARNYRQDLWKYRELFYVLSWRDLKVRYKQTAIGVLWAFIRPALTLVIFTIVFNRVAGLSAESNMPYALMVLAGLLPWQFFAGAVGESSNSLTQNSALITKVYFPKMIIPASTVVTSLVDFMIAFLLLLPLMFFYGYWPGFRLLFIPILLVPLLSLSLGFGLLLSALNVQFRDFRYVIPFLLQLGLYLSPVGFSSQALPERWQLWYPLNPMVGIIDAFRWAFSTLPLPFPWQSFGITCLLSGGIWLVGWRYFRRREKNFADVI